MQASITHLETVWMTQEMMLRAPGGYAGVYKVLHDALKAISAGSNMCSKRPVFIERDPKRPVQVYRDDSRNGYVDFWFLSFMYIHVIGFCF